VNVADTQDYIPVDVESVLDAFPVHVKVMTTVGLSLFLSDCEQQGISFDPIALDAVIRALVPVLVSFSYL
jgi:hypothetical protein